MRPAIVRPAKAAGRSGRVGGETELVSELEFRRAIRREKGRTERSRSPFILMLMDVGPLLVERPSVLPEMLRAISASTRDTDVVGWYETGGVLGVIYTEVTRTGVTQQAELLLERTKLALSRTLTPEAADRIGLSIHICPEDEAVPGMGPVRLASPIDAEMEGEDRTAALFAKRGMDILGSLLALILFFPILIAVAIAVKLTSKGPILYLQQRVGLKGRTFTFIKFRSMKTDNDPAIHRAYIEQFINQNASAERGEKKALYKIPNDPRVTRVGAFLRRTSLDEFPQFYNVLKGEMSLVGPRPPIPYEVNRYDAWHKRRYLSVKPGLTGLWQVHGRSRTTFDEMVRLDLLYARTWTIWGDVKILLQTPFAVLSGDGAM